LTPDQFLSQVKKQPAPAYLFIGPETYHRDACRAALLNRMLAPDERDDGFVRHDLETSTLASIVNDARSISLFAPRRVIWVARAEAALPKGRAAAADEDDAPKSKSDIGAEMLAAYLRDPVPDTVLVFDSARFENDGEDKAKNDRVRKLFAAVANQVEFPRLPPAQLRALAQDLAARRKLDIGAEELNLLVEACGGAAQRVATEIEKLSLFAGEDGRITQADIAKLVPQAQQANMFALVAALGKGDTRRAMALLDTLVREGEYLPLALQFLASQFRQALAAKQANLRGAGQVQGHFAKLGVPMWPSKAEQVHQTATSFTEDQLQGALRKIAGADRALRDIRPDDRIVMEEFVLTLTR
jgi:DNA polymerase-3 subunit delta